MVGAVIAIDLFAGAGGFTAGATAAGIRVVWAANHWALAVDVHRRNHPHVDHACQDLHQADWSQVPAHDVLLASPACQGHSRARGKDRPHHDAARSTAWAVVSCAEVHRPALVVVENVLEFTDWALWPAWCQAMRALGYTLAPQLLDAADVGVPQHRRRLYVVCTQSRALLMLPRPRMPRRPVRELIDWTIPTTPVERPGRAPATLARIASGRREFGDRFLVGYYGTETGGRSLDRPVGTLTTRARYAVVDGDRMRMLSVPELVAAMGFPNDYWLPPRIADATMLLGNAVCPPVATWLLHELRRAA